MENDYVLRISSIDGIWTDILPFPNFLEALNSFVSYRKRRKVYNADIIDFTKKNCKITSLIWSHSLMSNLLNPMG